jgi:N-acetyl-anhydromuramyl-L-alanine amidase AmpD
MEKYQTDQAAQICANWFVNNKAQDRDNPGSAHYTIDNSNIVQCVHDSDFAYGVLGSQGLFSYNDISLHFEHAGWSASTDWNSDYSQKMLRLSAQLTADRAKKFGVPLVYQNSTGLTAGQAGFTGHHDTVIAASIPGGHTDPGPNFPWSAYMQMVREAAGV